MIIRTEDDIRQLVESDEWMMDVLRAAETLNLPDWWIGAGFLRNKVWDAIADNPSANSRDVDLVYYDSKNLEPEADWEMDKTMRHRFPLAEWEVRNQARMHYKNGFDPYTSAADGISNWVETATCVAVKIENNTLKFLFCYGINDLVSLTARPIPQFRSDELIKVFHERLTKKEWQKRWPGLKVVVS